jgi:hypothetical protein
MHLSDEPFIIVVKYFMLMKSFFVSYTTIDSQISVTFLKELSCVLSTFGQSFIDLIDNDSVIDKQYRVEYELRNSDVLILVLTENTFNSKWVNREIDIAINSNIPIYKIEYNQLVESRFSVLRYLFSKD